MMWPTRRQLSCVVKYCLPSSCWPANTSHSRNSALSRPSPWRVMRPVTKACALIVRQSAKRGTASEFVTFSMKAAGLIGANRPERCKLLVMICVTPRAVSASAGAPGRKSGSAIEIGCGLPWLMSTRTAPRAGGVNSPAAAPRLVPAASCMRRRRDSAGEEKNASVIGISVLSLAEHVAQIEDHFHVAPLRIVLGTQHGVGLALQDGAARALGEHRAERRRRALDHVGAAQHRAVGVEHHVEDDLEVGRILGAERRLPALLDALA